MITPGLSRITRLLTHLPSQTYPTIHVAGTNGKGSVCTYLTSLFQHHALTAPSSPFQRIGRFTSPHLLTPGDSITINNVPIPTSRFSALSAHVSHINTREKIGASEFELLTATAFTAFAESDVDIGIIECGMGGRLDATNVLVEPIVTVITRLGYDHQAFLGGTAESIAREKAGIMREGVICVVDSTSEGGFLEEVVRQGEVKGAGVVLTGFVPVGGSEKTAKAVNATDEHAISSTSTSTSTPSTHANEFHDTLSRLAPSTIAKLSQIPQTSLSNIWTAYLTYTYALTHFQLPPPHPTSLDTLFTSLLLTPNPGRYQSLSITPLTRRIAPIILDGAHNTQAFALLVQHVSKQRKQPTDAITWILASTSTRDPSELLRLIPAQDRIVATTFSAVEGMPWVQAYGLQEWRKVLEDDGRGVWRVEEDVIGALARASELAEEGMLVVAGSLYLVGDVLRAVQKM